MNNFSFKIIETILIYNFVHFSNEVWFILYYLLENVLQEALEIYELPDLKREFELSAARTVLINCPPGNVLL